MFVIRGGDGQIVTSTAWDETNGEEIQYETYEQAEQALDEFEKSLPKDFFKIEATKCERCGGHDDLAIIHVNDQAKAYCQNCRVEMFSKKRAVGRPSGGVTKKVSLTLPEKEWDWLDEQAEGNRSQYLRRLVWEAQSSENEWSNNACLGYAILGAKKLGMNDEQIGKLVRAIYSEFDWKSVEEAKDTYNQSSF
ncbi:DUF2239 family protein [Bacillus cereus]|uniref:DUF2239 family protein n=1 Tax=Bacillus cereus group TaxID=86661 RepID=UPI000E818622|nr:hypothetical protein C1646_777469 [Rhizophagus diaphanus] [Rhizophagus sp. MUCL 43196]